ncbi:hypothetical protein BO221_49070 [Archangium sp. Cb G35]|uniref:hypothetical protein n=1 Tax=Archangium sp. Cb G35 TaxID=1920190 RepID=UPI000937B77C|nr:hypothetical protein [Archangium sp. Cb G35]OJT16587.1 hypothetical protein BO221_49070 [Archangium sp. Cb G35]
MKAEHLVIPTAPYTPESLCWSGDALIDWVSGGIRYGLDGSVADPSIRYGYRFDAAVSSQDGRYAALYEKLGTKAILLRDGKQVRELNRSYYHADAYEYPIALHTLPNGRTLLAHCPEEYCRLEIEDAETGERLTRRGDDSPDVFHSRLQFSRDGRFLLSAGWLWHPVDVAYAFDVTRALEQPESLDRPQDLELGESFLEIHTAALGARDTLVVWCSGVDWDAMPSKKEQPEDAAGFGVYSLTERRFLSMVPVEEPVGALMVMENHAVGFFDHPKLIELATGRVVRSWPGLATGKQGSSIIRGLPPQPPLAMDPTGCRFAVGTDKGIEVVRFTVP